MFLPEARFAREIKESNFPAALIFSMMSAVFYVQYVINAFLTKA